MLEVRYSAIESCDNLMVQPAAERSADGIRQIQNASQCVRSSKPSISKIPRRESIDLPFWPTVQ